MEKHVASKTCTGCRRTFPATTEFFHLHKPSKDGLKPRCKDCQCGAAKDAYRALDPEAKSAYASRVASWGSLNRRKTRQYAQRWRRRNPSRRRVIKAEFHQRKKATDPRYRLCAAMSCAVGKSLRGLKAGRKWQDLVGYSVEELKAHLEKLFRPGMSWANHGEWHIDHRRPISSFEIRAVTDAAFRECWALSNLQPLWAEDNLKKWNKWTS